MKDRQTALDEALAEATIDAVIEDEEPMVIACQGPPVCDRTFSDDVPGAERERVQMACPWCQRITVHADGSTTVQEPTRA